MQKVKLTFKTPEAKVGKDGQPTIVWKDEIQNHIVASTKSYNNLIEELKLVGKIATEVIVTDLFIDRNNTEKVLTELVNLEIKDADIAKYVINHIIKSLDGSCVFKKAPIVRKKV